MTDLLRMALFVLVDLCAIWAAGYVLASEDVVGGQRTRFENWTYGAKVDRVRYRDGNMVDEFGFDPAVDFFWDRVTAWCPFSRPKPGGSRLDSHELTWGFGDKGRKVPLRLDSPNGVLYAVPMVAGPDGQNRRLRAANRAVTVLRGKVADLWGCPRCSGWWGGLVIAVLADVFGRFHLPILAVLVLHVPAWGLARRLDWSHGD